MSLLKPATDLPAQRYPRHSPSVDSAIMHAQFFFSGFEGISFWAGCPPLVDIMHGEV
jgi:hypothetical protein